MTVEVLGLSHINFGSIIYVRELDSSAALKMPAERPDKDYHREKKSYFKSGTSHDKVTHKAKNNIYIHIYIRQPVSWVFFSVFKIKTKSYATSPVGF